MMMTTTREKRRDDGRVPLLRESERDLGDVVLSWSLEDMLDDNLYRGQVKKIPDTFVSIDHYLEAYAIPVIEETRSELCSSLEAISKAPSSKILTIEDAGLGSKGPTFQCSYYIDVDFWNDESGCGSETYKARNGDFFILSSTKPEALNDLSRYGVAYCTALVTEVAMDDEFQKGFKVKVSKPIDVDNYNFAIFLTNILTQIRIWRALSRSMGLNDNFNLIKTLLSPQYKADETCDSCISRENDVQFTRFLDILLDANLNHSQYDAVQAAVSSVQCEHSCSVKLIWGPPGTGKTKTVSAILWVFLCMKYRTLACAPTNVAVVGLCLRLLEFVKKFSYDDNLNGLSQSFGDVVLFGNRDRMEMKDDLEYVFLDDRVDQLADCFAPSSGWKHRIVTVINFLENCISDYDLFTENDKNESGVSLLEFIRKQFDNIAFPLRSCFRCLWIHIPTSSFSDENAKSMFALIDSLDTFRSLLSDGYFTDEELNEIFLNEGHESSRGERLSLCNSMNSEILSPTGRALGNARMECLRILKILQRTLTLPYAVEKYWIKKFCLQKAKVIFCTASSSSLLHYMEMDPLDVLVIDEAAQLKECESTIPLRIKWLNHAILVGDEYQLSALVKSQVSMEAGLGMSLFERLVSLGYQKHLLNVQYRMHPAISFFPNRRFYTRQILDGPNVQDSRYGRNYPNSIFGTYAFIHIADGKEERDDSGKSWKNMVEVACIMHIVRSLFKYWDGPDGTGHNHSIGVLSPYSAQVNEINEKLRNKYDMVSGFHVRVRSIDGFQGEEDDVIIVSTVRSNNNSVVGFLRDLHRTNVALTRARHRLWLLGNATTLEKSRTIWAEVVQDAKERKCFFNANDDKALAKAIIHAKHELNQLDDLFNSDSAFLCSARWQVLFSDEFRKSFAKLKSLQFKREILQMLLILADGWRSKRNNRGFEDSFRLARIYKIRELFLIWTVDVVKNERYVQVIRIWDLSSAAQITRLLKRLNNIFAMYTDNYIEHCRATCIEGKLEVPMTWKTGHDIIRYKQLCRNEPTDVVNAQPGDLNIMENSKVSESLLLMKFYSLSSGIVKHLLTASDGTELDFPYELTELEEEIIRFPRSAFILGRSGTGKTTVLTMKLIQKEQHHCVASKGIYSAKERFPEAALRSDFPNNDSNENSCLRQVFVTVSPKLCSAISSHIYRLKSFVSSGDLSTAAKVIDMHDFSDNITDFVDIPDCFRDLPKNHYPLVITFWKFLMMLDGTVGNSFFDRFYDERELLMQRDVSKTLALQAFLLSKEVNYERFVGSYWPHFNIQLTKTLDASTVFTQIISHIKGGLQRGMVYDGKIGKEDYVMLSEKRVSSLSRETRERIYDIFLDYERKKHINREFDLSDFVMDLHCRLVRDGYPGDKVDFVYIDEVQDLTMKQIALFKYVCKNFQEGFIFAGDTAQTIARGIDFRFEDIRSLFYTDFLSEQYSKHDWGVNVRDMFQLNQNFRTHAGVLKLAESIMALLYSFFPLCVDKLIPETSLIYGEAPVLLECANNENAIITIFGNSGGSGYTVNGFGSEQVILVRDDNAKKQILDLVGKQALVLTILECKGLEFQDVLLYNFFGASPLKNKWRVVYQYMKDQDLDPSVTRSFPSFDGAKHNLLCSELKQLYVAITRTKQRLWICESTDEYSKPMFDYWKSLCLVQVRHLDSSLAQAMKQACSPEDWKLRGIKLFNEGNFEMATMCFERAGDEYREKWARASGLYATADLIISSNCEMGETALKKAAEIYESIGKSETAALCFIKLKDFRKAGMIYLEKCGTSRLEDAGDCLSKAECWSLAVDVYSKAKCFSKCLSICSKGELLDEGLQFIEKWREESYFKEHRHQELDELEMSYLQSCADHCYKVGNLRHMIKFVKAFHSMELIRSFLNSRNLLDELLQVEVESGNYLEAAAISKIKGDILLEAELLEKAHHFQDAAKLIIFHVVVTSLWAHGNKGWPLQRILQNENLLTKVKQLAEQDPSSDSFYKSVCFETYILSANGESLMNLSKHLVEVCKSQNVRLEIFTVRLILDFHLNSEPSQFMWESDLVLNDEMHTYKLLSQNKFSLETFIHMWNLLRVSILKVLSYINSFETTNENNQIYEEFCLEYFGVKKEDGQNRYTVLNTNASWVKKFGVSLRSDGNWMNGYEFMLCAQRYWRTELLSVSMAVLEKLESLHSFSLELPSAFSKGRVILSLYEVAKFLKETEFVTLRNAGKIHDKILYCQRYFYDIVFPLDWKTGVSKGMITLLENKTAREILEPCLTKNINPRNGIVTYGQIARMVVLLILTGELSDNLFERIIKFLDKMPLWKDFIISLKNFLDSGFGRIPLICKFQEALGSTFYTDWTCESDYITPHCFIHLIQCLLFFGTSCQGLKGYLFSTRSLLFEMLKCQVSQRYICACLTASDAQFQHSIDGVLGFIVNVVTKLISDKHGILHWIKRSSFPTTYYPIFLLKLVILLCVGYLNIGRDLSGVGNLLLSNAIFEDLPRPFSAKLRNAFSNRKYDWAQLLRVFSDALQEAGDPLVVICSQDNYSKFSNLKVCVICSEEMKCRESVITKLFPMEPIFQHKKSFEAPQEKLINRSSGGNNRSSIIPADHQRLKVQTTDVKDPEVNYSHVSGKCSDIIYSRSITNCAKKELSEDVGAFAANLELENVCQVLHAGILWLEQNHCGHNLIGEMRGMLDEFKLLPMSKNGANVTFPRIGELCAKWQKWEPWLQTLKASVPEDELATAELLQSLQGINETQDNEEIVTIEVADSSSISQNENTDREGDQCAVETPGSADDGDENVAETVGTCSIDQRKGNQKERKKSKKKSKAKGKGKGKKR